MLDLYIFRFDVLFCFNDALLDLALLGFLLLVSEEVGNVAFVFGTVDGYDERWRVISHFAHVFADWIYVQLAIVRFEEILEFFGPLISSRVEPGTKGIRAVVKNDGHSVMEEVELFV